MITRIKAKAFNREIPDGRPCASARAVVRRGGFVVWDTETTGIDDDAEIVEISAVDQDGTVVLDTLIKPQYSMPDDAYNIHGISDETLATAPTFAEAYPMIRAALHRYPWVIWNASFDTERLNYECDRHYLPRILPATEWVMPDGYFFDEWEQRLVHCHFSDFAIHYGEWSEYFGNYKWQSLATAMRYYNQPFPEAHRALADAHASLTVLRHMALDEDKEHDDEME